MAFARVGGTKIYWDEQGQGEPVLMIMGLGWSSNMWHRTRPALSDRYRTIAFDNRGAGRSDTPPGPYTMVQMSGDAAAVLDAAEVETAPVVGASMGGMIAQEFALQYPKRVRSLVLVCTSPGGPHAVQAEPEVIQMLFRREGNPKERAEAVVPYIYDRATPRERIDEDLRVLSEWYPNQEGYMAQLQGILAWEAYSRLPQIIAPTLVIHGVNDRLVPPGNAEVIAGRIPHAQLVKVNNAGHILMTDQSALVHQTILGFLAAP